MTATAPRGRGGHAVRAGSATTLVLAALSVAAPAPPAPAASETFNYGRFGAVSIYRGHGDPRDMVLFLSGDGGWNLGVISMALRLAAKDAIVAGIDIRYYLAQLENAAEECVSPAVDFENLSHDVQSKLGLKNYLQPTLVGYSSGATLVYAALVESPEGSFNELGAAI